jgi:hypothetical protein
MSAYSPFLSNYDTSITIFLVLPDVMCCFVACARLVARFHSYDFPLTTQALLLQDTTAAQPKASSKPPRFFVGAFVRVSCIFVITLSQRAADMLFTDISITP